MSQPSFIQNARYERGRKCPYSTSETDLDRALLRKEGNRNPISGNGLYLKDCFLLSLKCIYMSVYTYNYTYVSNS